MLGRTAQRSWALTRLLRVGPWCVAVVVAVVFAAGCTATPDRPGLSDGARTSSLGPTHRTSQTSGAPVSSLAGSPSASPGGRLVGAWAARTVGGPAGNDIVLAGDADALFTVLNSSTPVQTLRRVDPATGQVLATRRGTDIDGPAVILAGRLWVVSLRSHRLEALDLRSLATRTSLHTVAGTMLRDAAIVGAVPGTSRIYVLYGDDHIAVIDGTHTRAVHSYRIPGRDISAAVDPTGTRMYVVANGMRNNTETHTLTVRDPDTGAMLQTSDYQPAIGPGQMGVLAASRGGVWITEGSGMTYLAAFHPADNLDITTRARGTSSGGLPITVSVYPTVAWLGSEDNLLCADPESGTVRARTNTASGSLGIFDITKAGSRLFADSYTHDGTRRLVTITAPHICTA
jgi:hypothetical protein